MFEYARVKSEKVREKRSKQKQTYHMSFCQSSFMRIVFWYVSVFVLMFHFELDSKLFFYVSVILSRYSARAFISVLFVLDEWVMPCATS